MSDDQPTIPATGLNSALPTSDVKSSTNTTPPIKRRRRKLRMIFWVCAFLMSVGFGVYLRAEIQRRVTDLGLSHTPTFQSKGGTLLIVGGGNLPNMIRHRFIELAGGTKARIVVIPAVAADKEELWKFREPWDEFPLESLDVLNSETRAQSDDPEFSRMLETATGVWLSGGSQLWLSGLYGRTLVEARLKDVLSRDGVIGGTSAGAAIMSGVMIAGGQQNPRIARGFDLIPDAIIDQHFLRRNRFRRMQSALEDHPGLIGFGIDEGTALQYSVKSGRFRVLGHSCVVAALQSPNDHWPNKLRIEFFNPGDDFDVDRLRSGDPVPPSAVDFDTILLGE